VIAVYNKDMSICFPLLTFDIGDDQQMGLPMFCEKSRRKLLNVMVKFDMPVV
jgi:hypothetical protein